MQYTKPMIELVYEIRRLVPAELKPGVKLANPELFDELRAFYRGKKSSTIVKALIKELFNLAGEHWPQYLDVESASKLQLETKHYRGVVSLEEKPPKTAQGSGASGAKKKMIYRGQVVA